MIVRRKSFKLKIDWSINLPPGNVIKSLIITQNCISEPLQNANMFSFIQLPIILSVKYIKKLNLNSSQNFTRHNQFSQLNSLKIAFKQQMKLRKIIKCLASESEMNLANNRMRFREECPTKFGEFSFLNLRLKRRWLNRHVYFTFWSSRPLYSIHHPINFPKLRFFCKVEKTTQKIVI